jgi:Na+-translocating ferredoxin:NAD+ oxidoreductase RnfG subunit
MKILMLTVLYITNSAEALELVSVKDFLKAELSTSEKLTKETFTLNEEQKKSLSKVTENATDSDFTFYYGKKATGELEKTCTTVNEQGKEGPIVLGLCFDKNNLLSQIRVLSSEEERGRKIEEDAFLSQFRGKKISDPYQLGQDINGVSGATWSSRAVANAARKATFAFKTFVINKK